MGRGRSTHRDDVTALSRDDVIALYGNDVTAHYRDDVAAQYWEPGRELRLCMYKLFPRTGNFSD